MPIEIGDPAGTRWELVEALADTGATLTMIPPPVWQSLGLQASGSRSFALADGSRVSLPVASARIRIEGEEQVNPIVAGLEGSDPLLGAVTLETFFLAVDPVGRKLVPTDGYLL